MKFRMFTLYNGHKIAFPVDDVRCVTVDPDSPNHSIIVLKRLGEPVLHEGDKSNEDVTAFNLVYHIDEDFFTALSRLNTIAE